MKTAALLLAVVLTSGTAIAAQGPEIQVVDGKISMAVSAMPLGRLMTLLDRAMGTTSEVKPELSNRNISAQFSGLEYNEAIRKIFQGQPLNYMIISGKGVLVTELAQAGAATATNAPVVSPFPEQQQVFPGNNPIPPTLNIQPPQIIGGNAQQTGPNGNPTFTMTPFGPQPTPAGVANQATAPATGGAGQLPTPLGGNNPFVTPFGVQGSTTVNNGTNGSPFPTTTPAPQAPAAGTLGGTTPGTLGR